MWMENLFFLVVSLSPYTTANYPHPVAPVVHPRYKCSLNRPQVRYTGMGVHFICQVVTNSLNCGKRMPSPKPPCSRSPKLTMHHSLDTSRAQAKAKS